MIRLAMFIAVVLLLFQAGFHRVRPAPATGPGTSATVAAAPLPDRIGRPLPAREDRAAPALPAGFPATPAAFDLAAATRADPATLPGSPAPEGNPNIPAAHFRVAAARLSLRAGPSSLYPEIATLLGGDTLLAPLPESGGWLWVSAERAGLSGYVAAGLVATDD
jgi:hypothetical protein